jgi:broad-specificity NMP kinase
MISGITIGVTGTCGSGKSELVTRLKERGYNVRHIAQEHSYAPRMWRQISNPDLLIFLEVSYAVTLKRIRFKWTEEEYLEQLHRLRDAREHANIRINSDSHSPTEIYEKVINMIEGKL